MRDRSLIVISGGYVGASFLIIWCQPLPVRGLRTPGAGAGDHSFYMPPGYYLLGGSLTSDSGVLIKPNNPPVSSKNDTFRVICSDTGGTPVDVNLNFTFFVRPR